MIDLVKCSHCDRSVLWADYGDHVEQAHGSWRGFQQSETIESRALATMQDEQGDLQAQLDKEIADNSDLTDDLNDENRSLTLELKDARERIEELKDQIESLGGTVA